MIRYALLAEESASVVSYQQVVFNTYAAEILVGFEHLIVDEVFVQSLRLPVVYECRYEIKCPVRL